MGTKDKSSQSWAVALFTIGVFMAGLDNGIISTALTTINDTYNVSPSWGTWSVTIYTLGIAISVPIIGKLSDKYGRRKLFIIEIALFGIGSLLVALSPSFSFLLFSRFLQAIGGGGIFIIGSSYILSTLPREKQGKALGMLGGMHGLSAVIGPNLGAFILTSTGSWHWMFLINLPIALFLIIFGYLKISDSKPGTQKPLDIIGSIYLSIGIIAFMYGITQLDSSALWGSLTQPGTFLFLVAGSVSLVLFVNHERILEKRGGDPIVFFSLLRQRGFQLTLLLGLLSGGFLAGIIFIPAYVQQVLHVPVAHAGYWLTPLAVASGIGAGAGGVLTDRFGAVKAVIVSGIVGLIGFIMFPMFVNEFATFLVASILAGVGLGILLGAPLNVLAGQSATDNGQGSALGTLSLVRQMGLTLFPTIYAGFMTGAMIQSKPVIEGYSNEQLDASSISYTEIMNTLQRIQDPGVQHQLMGAVDSLIRDGFSHMFITAAILSLLVIIIGLLLRKQELKGMK